MMCVCERKVEGGVAKKSVCNRRLKRENVNKN